METLAENQHLLEEYDTLREKYHLQMESKPSVETFVRTRAEIAEKEIDTLCDDLRDVLFEMKLDLAQGHIFRMSTEKSEDILAEIKSLLERRWNDEKVLNFIEENDL